MAICSRIECSKKYDKIVPWKKYCCRECMLLVWANKKLLEKNRITQSKKNRR